MYGRASKRELLYKLAPGLWMYNNSGLYGGEAAVAVNQTTQQVIMQRSGASLSPTTLANTTPIAREVHGIMSHLSERMIKGTARILSKPQTRTSLQEPGFRGFPQQFSTSTYPAPQHQSSKLHSFLTENAHPALGSTYAKSAHRTAYARTKLAPSCIRSRANYGPLRSFATEAGYSKISPQSALVKYAPPTGPLDRVGRAQLLSAAPNFMARLKIRLKLLLMRQVRPWRMDDFIAMFSWAFLANVAFILLGTTTFFSLVLATANSLQFQGMIAFVLFMHCIACH